MRRFLPRTFAAITALCLTVSLFPAARADDVPGQTPEPESGTAVLTVGEYLQARQALAELGYTAEESAALCAALSPEGLVRLAGLPLCSRLAQYAALPYFREEDLERYLAYGEAHPELDAQDVVTYVNIGLDRAYYTEIDTVEQPDRTDVLVNKYHTLGSGYTPELVRMDPAYTTRSADYLQPEAYEWFVKMADAAREEGLRLRSVSAYRSYATQRSLFNGYAARSGAASAERYSARPGHSEHQTGLAMDINVASTSAHFERTREYQWLTEHCWEYGYILRYPQEDTPITGYIFEPWHYRYVGVELAGQIRDSGLTYDEFVARQSVRAQLPAVTLDGTALELELIRLAGEDYLPVGALVQALGWSCEPVEEQLSVSAPAGEVVLDPQVLGGDAFEGELYLPIQALVQTLGLGLWRTQTAVILSSAPADPDWPFLDVLPYHDSYDAVRFVWRGGLLSGVSEDRFDPEGAVTRGMAVTVLSKLDPDGSGQEEEKPSFPDVDGEEWYAPGVAWAQRTGLVSGYGDGGFHPNEPMTWEQAAAVLQRFARYTGRVLTAGEEGEEDTDALEWAVEGGLLETGEDEFDPQRPITRAELSWALQRLCGSGEQLQDEIES